MTLDANERPMPNRPARSILAVFGRGLMFAVASVVVVAVLAAIWGAIFGYHPSATIFGSAPPGLEGAAAMAMFYAVFAGPPVAIVAFFVGIVWALVRRPKTGG